MPTKSIYENYNRIRGWIYGVFFPFYKKKSSPYIKIALSTNLIIRLTLQYFDRASGCQVTKKSIISEK